MGPLQVSPSLSIRAPPCRHPGLCLAPGKSSLLMKLLICFFPRCALRHFGSQLVQFAFALVIVLLCKRVYRLLPSLCWIPPQPAHEAFHKCG